MRHQFNHGPAIAVLDTGHAAPALAGTVNDRLSALGQRGLALRIWLSTSAVNVLLLGVCIAGILRGGVSGPLLAATFFGFVINVYLWSMLRTRVVRPLHEALDGARAIATGDLSVTFTARSNDEMGQLMRAMQQMRDNLVAVIGDVRDSARTVSGATGRIATGNRELSGRTVAQAASLEQTAASMEQFAATVKENADNSLRGRDLADVASRVAVHGGAAVDDVTATMKQINTSSHHIADILGVIQGISFQTNILALNAAVEAARAGEQGRGFAVVAGEVRALAQRTSVAAKEIGQLIEVSVGRVGTGMQQVERAGQTMRDVVDAVQQVVLIMQDISRASQEQSIGIDQVNQAVARLDTVTRQNAIQVEEAADAAASLDLQAASLERAVSVLDLGGAQAHPAAPARSAGRRPATTALAVRALAA
jgi:aerotaxis receptor